MFSQEEKEKMIRRIVNENSSVMEHLTEYDQLNITYEIDEDGYYIVTCHDFDGCYSQGKTLDEAKKNIKEAIELCIETKK